MPCGTFEVCETRLLLAADTWSPTAIYEASQQASSTPAQTTEFDGNLAGRPRLIVLTDIGGDDPDDEQSMVRLLSYANEFQIEGLIAGSHLNRDEGGSVEKIFRIIDHYATVQPNLQQHAQGFPSASELRDTVARGQPRRTGIGPEMDTEGSQHIIAVVDKPDPRAVYVAIWGGATDLAQALWRVRAERTAEQTAAFVGKLRISWIEQDPTAPWIKENFPNLWIVSHLVPEQPLENAPFRGMYLGGDTLSTGAAWVAEKVKEHRPWGDVYPATGAGAAMKEGDTPTWFYFLPSNLSNPDHPDWGGWGGRFEAEGPLHAPVRDTTEFGTLGRNTVNRWREEFQNDFEARMDWSTTASFSEANHNPIAVVSGGPQASVVAGQEIVLDASGSYDPDGDSLSFEWFHYADVGSYADPLPMASGDGSTLRMSIPSTNASGTAHIILRVRDDGGRNAVGPDLFDYQRIVLDIQPRLRADIDGSGQVDFADFLIVAGQFGESDDLLMGDLDADQQVAFSDFLILSAELLRPNNDTATQNVFSRFLILSENFGNANVDAESGDEDGDGVVGFSDFLSLAASI